MCTHPSVRIATLNQADISNLEEKFTFNDLSSKEYELLPSRLHSVIPKSGDFERLHQKLKIGEESGLIAWIGDGPVGWLSIRWIGDHDIHRIKHSHPEAKKYLDTPALYNLWVRSTYRKKGIGKQLIAEAERLAKQKGYSKIGITVDDINSIALMLYKHLGFQESGIGLFSTSGKYFKGDKMMEWVNGPMQFLIKSII